MSNTMSAPIIDEVYSALLNQDLEQLDRLGEQRPEDAAYLRALISTRHEGGASVDVDLSRIRSEAPFMASLFEGPRFFFISPETSVRARVTGGSSVVPVDWTFSFDSNVAEKVRAYLSGENLSEADGARVMTLLRLKKEYSIQVDLVPFLFENLRLARDNPRNQRPLRTIAAFKALDYLDWPAFDKDPTCPVVKRTWRELECEASATYDSLVSNTEVIFQETKASFAAAVLLSLAEQWMENPQDKERAFAGLIDFCLFELGKLPVYELGLAWDFLCRPQGLRFFGPLAGLANNLLQALRGMAWDLTHLRALETMATMRPMQSGFFLPFFVSFDRRLVELIEHNPTRFLLMDVRTKRLQSGRARDRTTQMAINTCMSERARASMGHVNQQARRNQALDMAKLREVVAEKEKRVAELAAADGE